jgi:hypothetical protein
MAADASDPVVDWYSKHVGEPDSAVDIYLGFGAFFAGLAMGIGGLALFLAEGALLADEGFWLKEVSFAVGAFGLPTLLLGVVVLLPVDRRALYLGIAGTAVTLAAIALFVWAYPNDWNVDLGPDYSGTGVALYAVGLVAVVAASGTALVSYHVERAGGGPIGEGRAVEDTGPEVTDDQVRSDIDEATAASNMTWGGVPETREQRLTFAGGEEGIQSTNFGEVGAKTVRASDNGVDDAVAGLKGMKGDVDRTDRGGSTDDETAALSDLKRKREAAERARAERSTFERLRHRARELLGR